MNAIWIRNARCLYIKKLGPLPSVTRYFSTNGQTKVVSSTRIKWFWMPAGVGFALISFIQLRHIQDRERQKRAPLEKDSLGRGMPLWQVNLFKVVPTRALSRFWGKVHDVDLPASFRGPVVRLWTWAFDCRLEEAEVTDPCQYPNLGAFFTRKLKQGARVVDQDSELVCPVDGRVLHFGRLADDKLEQVKGVSYSLESFLGPRSTHAHYPSQNKTLYQCVLYLGPGDCHHFHSPAEWNIEAQRHFPGELYSVSPWVLKGFQDVLNTNERVSLFGNWKHGAFAMTAVGAYNVGSIKILSDKELRTNHRKAKRGDFEEKRLSMVLGRGDHVGWFAMGSAVVLIFEAPDDFEFVVKHGQKVMLGQALGYVLKREN